ncbi:MAG: nucleoside-diphosphate sugar epimerase [Bacteroidetes bacterium HGW-Bacteroidetes-21]|jgi:FlaA1/EpsC-like NDP-sugar epimerase|nr:MAG: nucleoside-diphosphate sugar epimerase [Bacteroidetes bacterium HGW-Bacteroidetes-21]
MINLDKFIAEKVVGRPTSLLATDLEKFNNELHARIDGRSVLVIGGAGTIGSSYIRAILKFNVKRLYVVDINENGLTELVRDLRSATGYNIPADFKTYPINFGDPVFEKLFVNEGPFEIVANFAAHKHVRSEKDEYSIEAMIENNVLKAKKLLDLLLSHKPEHFFCVSTDKAANPVNIMGASKKLMEEVIMAYADAIPITTARFANVAFSNGSLPQGFLERFSKRHPWSCPSDVKRFFVSPQESGQICLLASILGESGDIFFPKLDMVNDMKPFTLIVDALLKEYGLAPDICASEEEARQKALLLNENSKTYPVYYFSSDTSGEKSYEEFYTEHETLDMVKFPNLGVVKNTKARSKEEIENIFANLRSLFSHGTTKAGLVEALKRYLPNFEHIETGKNLDQKM